MVYRCRVCGYLFDEEKEGTSISQLKECPVCGQPAENFVPVETDGGSAAGNAAENAAENLNIRKRPAKPTRSTAAWTGFRLWR